MKTIVHKANSRGHNSFSWLNSYHSFSFGHYYDENRMQFGALRVLNDDTVAPGGGFGAHPHQNMEIVSIPLSGVLAHKDSMGNAGLISPGDVQIMSAGTGVTHSEFNHSTAEEVKFLQIWVLPETSNLQPTYDQKTFDMAKRINQWQTLVSPDGLSGVKINQKSWFEIIDLDAGKNISYRLHGAMQGAYIFLLNGQMEVAGEVLNSRDAIGVWELENLTINAMEASTILLLEVPMN